MRDLNQFKGCLIGGAVGDALGYPVEAMSASTIHAKYGEEGITEYELRDGVAEISADTQLTLFTATGLLLGTTRGMTRGIGGIGPDYPAFSYLDWYRTQTEEYPLPREYQYSWLSNLPEMFKRRTHGSTCMSALARRTCGELGRIDHPLNQSKGCAGVVRVAPIGIYLNDHRYYNSEADVDMLGAEVAAITHGHELGYIPAAMLVHIIARITGCGDTILEAVEDSLIKVPSLFPDSKHMRELTSLIFKAMLLSQQNLNDLDAIHQLGEGWVAEEALAIAVYCALKYEDNFERGVLAAVNHDGDSNSTGAIAGNILGAALGFDAIPPRFTDKLELKDVIIEIAGDLHHDCQISEYDMDDELWVSKYISMTYKRRAK